MNKQLWKQENFEIFLKEQREEEMKRYENSAKYKQYKRFMKKR